MTFKWTVSLLAIVAGSPAFAQSDPTQPATDYRGDDVIVTASRSGDAQPIDLIGASATLLTDQDLQDRQTRIVSDVLRDVPGVEVNRTGGIGGLTQVRIRGSESNQVLVLIDGIEADDPYQGEFDFGTLLADEDAKIEVLRGQQSSLYGSDAIGGVIQYITLTGAEAPGISLRAEGGSFGTFSGGARAAGVTGDVDYAVTGSYLHTRGYPTAVAGHRDIGADLAGASGKVTWTPSDRFKLTAVGRYSLTDADSNDTSYDPSSPLFGTLIDTPGEYFRNIGWYGLLRGELTSLDGRWTNALSAQFADTKRAGFADGAFSYGDKGRRYKASYESALRFGSDRVRHTLTFAADAERELFRTTTPGAFDGWRHTDNLGVVGEYDLLVDDALAIGASVRHDFNSRFADDTTYRAEASYRFKSGTRAHAAYGTGVKAPTYFEQFGYIDGQYIGNAGLKPEKSKGWEAGVEQQIGGPKLIAGATFFDNRLLDEIVSAYPPPDYVQTSVNSADVSHQHGIETYLSAKPSPQLRFDLAYTWLHARQDGLPEVRRPANIASLDVTATTRDQRLSGTLTVRYNGRQDDLAYTDPSYVPVRARLDDYTLVNLAAQYRLSSRFTVYGRVENLFGERYQEVFAVSTAGRAAYGGVKARF